MKRKSLAALAVIGLLTTSAALTPVSAAGTESTKKAVDAYYGVQIEYNSKALSSTTPPFIVNGTTYVPLRMLMDAFSDKSTTWDAANRKVVITSGTSQTEQMYTQQITARNTQITELQAKITALEAEKASLLADLEDAEDSDSDLDLSDLEDALNDDYGDYDDYSFDIALDGDEDDIEVTIDTDSDDWDALTTTQQENLLQYICEDIWDEADSADITGTVEDGSTELGTFTADASDDVSLDEDTDLSDLEDTLNADYGDYSDYSIDISISGDSDGIDLVVDVDSDDWEDLVDDDDAESLLQDICDDIWDEYEDAAIDGSIEDGSTTLDSFSVDADEDVSL